MEELEADSPEPQIRKFLGKKRGKNQSDEVSKGKSGMRQAYWARRVLEEWRKCVGQEMREVRIKEEKEAVMNRVQGWLKEFKVNKPA